MSDEKIFKTRPFDPVANLGFSSSVDIIIPFHGCYEKVSRLIESIFQHTKSNYYRLIFVDDASDNKFFMQEKLMALKSNSILQPEIVCVQLEKQVGFGGALSAGFSQNKFPWVVFLNSDCVVEDINWLKNLGICMLNLKKHGVKMVSSRMNNCVGGDERMIGKKEEITEDIILDEGFISLVCTMCHRDLFQRIGGFVKPYPYGWYEDQELADRMKFYGFKQAICGNSWIYHEGEQTIRNFARKPYYKRIMLENEQKYLEDVKNFIK